MEDEYNTGYWFVKPVYVIFGAAIALVALVMFTAKMFDVGYRSGVTDATNYIAAKCQQRNEFRVATGANTFFFQCNLVKNYPVTPWDDIDVNKPFDAGR